MCKIYKIKGYCLIIGNLFILQVLEIVHFSDTNLYWSYTVKLDKITYVIICLINTKMKVFLWLKSNVMMMSSKNLSLTFKDNVKRKNILKKLIT